MTTKAWQDDDFASALRARTESRAKRLRAAFRKAQGGDPKAVHDARTESRRLRVVLALIARVFGEAQDVLRLEQRLRHIEKSLGPVRDLDVLILDAETQPGLGALVVFANKKRAKAVKAASEALRCGPKLLDEVIRETRHALSHKTHSKRCATRHFVREHMWGAYEELLAFETLRSDQIDVLHAYRRACRRLRYTWEVFEPVLPSGAAVRDDLHEREKSMSALRDAQVALEWVAKWTNKQRLALDGALSAYMALRHDMRTQAAESAAEHAAYLMSKTFERRLAAVLESATPDAPRHERSEKLTSLLPLVRLPHARS